MISYALHDSIASIFKSEPVPQRQGNQMDEHGKYPDYLRRLPPKSYQAQAYVHWVLTIDDRQEGWLDEAFHQRFRQYLTHACFRYQQVCPVYCMMPDHIHLIWAGVLDCSDQKLGMRFLRKHLNCELSKVDRRLQKQAFDHVLRESERKEESFYALCDYIARNPERKRLIPVDHYQEWPYTGCLVLGFPDLSPFQADYWPSFWRCYSYLIRTQFFLQSSSQSDDTPTPKQKSSRLLGAPGWGSRVDFLTIELYASSATLRINKNSTRVLLRGLWLRLGRNRKVGEEMTKPKMIASENGLEALRQVFPRLLSGSTAIDACVAAATIVENDPEELTVGFGGLPNCDGVVELDAAVMCGRTHRAGGVAAMQGIRNPAQVARLVMQQTQRVLLAGDGAKQFALANGFNEENLLTETSRRLWMLWRRQHDAAGNWVKPGIEDPDYDLVLKYPGLFERLPTGTVHIAALDSYGNLACVTSTSGHAFKIPGRVGDSPIVGAGLYADNAAGTCGSVGRGETNQENLTSYAIVRRMRDGIIPRHAAIEEWKLIAPRLRPNLLDQSTNYATFDLRLYVMSSSGEHASFSCLDGQSMSIADKSGIYLEPCVHV